MVKLELTISEELLQKAARKYHYLDEDMEELRRVARDLEEAMGGRSGFWCKSYEWESAVRGDALGIPPVCLCVAMTLGEGVDALQEHLSEEGELTRCYMAEALGNELLLEAYASFHQWVEKSQGRGVHVARYHFYGGEEALPLEKMREALMELGQDAVTCNDCFCLRPKKSVVFVAELTADPAVACQGICVGCDRKDCPNRVEKSEEAAIRWPDLPMGALPYGYARILRWSTLDSGPLEQE